MSQYENAVARYLAAWNATDADDRAKAVAEAWVSDGWLTDPLVDVAGHDQLTAMIGGVQAQLPDHEVRLTGPVDGHHTTARFTWEMVSRVDGSAPVAGSDVITLADDGRIVGVLGFLDRVPAGA